MFPYPKSIKSPGGLIIPVMIPPRDYTKFMLILALQQQRELAQGLQCIKHPRWHLLSTLKSRVKTKVLKNNSEMIVPLARCFYPLAAILRRTKAAFPGKLPISGSQLEGIDSQI